MQIMRISLSTSGADAGYLAIGKLSGNTVRQHWATSTPWAPTLPYSLGGKGTLLQNNLPANHRFRGVMVRKPGMLQQRPFCHGGTALGTPRTPLHDPTPSM